MGKDAEAILTQMGICIAPSFVCFHLSPVSELYSSPEFCSELRCACSIMISMFIPFKASSLKSIYKSVA